VVAGSGRNSGKTTLVCKLIEQFQHLGIISIKISSHFHAPVEGLIPFSGKPGYEIYEETNPHTLKDSSRMLRSGAEKVFYIQTMESCLEEAFSDLYQNLKSDKPIICESPSLVNYITPGLFVIMVATDSIYSKNIDDLKKQPHLEYTYDEIMKTESLPIGFADGCWKRPGQIAVITLQ
jgi:hypothetical protein